MRIAWNRQDLTGHRFDRLTAIAYLGNGKWRCRCDCGNERDVLTSNLTRGNTKSCGCLKSEVTATRMAVSSRRHGLEGTVECKAWQHILDRCYNPNCHSYPKYGGRGIRVCEALRTTPANLLALLGPRPPTKKSLGRINNDGHYSCGRCAECLRCAHPLNVRWEDDFEQAGNKRNSRLLTRPSDGKCQCLNAWARELGRSNTTIASRIKRGWPMETALTH